MQGFAMDSVLSVSRTNPMIGYLNKSYPEGKTKAVTDKKHQPFLLARNEGVSAHLPSLSIHGSILTHEGPNIHPNGYSSPNIQVMFTSPAKSHLQEPGAI